MPRDFEERELQRRNAIRRRNNLPEIDNTPMSPPPPPPRAVIPDAYVNYYVSSPPFLFETDMGSYEMDWRSLSPSPVRSLRREGRSRFIENAIRPPVIFPEDTITSPQYESLFLSNPTTENIQMPTATPPVTPAPEAQTFGRTVAPLTLENYDRKRYLYIDGRRPATFYDTLTKSLVTSSGHANSSMADGLVNHQAPLAGVKNHGFDPSITDANAPRSIISFKDTTHAYEKRNEFLDRVAKIKTSFLERFSPSEQNGYQFGKSGGYISLSREQMEKQVPTFSYYVSGYKNDIFISNRKPVTCDVGSTMHTQLTENPTERPLGIHRYLAESLISWFYVNMDPLDSDPIKPVLRSGSSSSIVALFEEDKTGMNSWVKDGKDEVKKIRYRMKGQTSHYELVVTIKKSSVVKQVMPFSWHSPNTPVRSMYGVDYNCVNFYGLRIPRSWIERGTPPLVYLSDIDTYVLEGDPAFNVCRIGGHHCLTETRGILRTLGIMHVAYSSRNLEYDILDQAYAEGHRIRLMHRAYSDGPMRNEVVVVPSQDSVCVYVGSANVLLESGEVLTRGAFTSDCINVYGAGYWVYTKETAERMPVAEYLSGAMQATGVALPNGSPQAQVFPTITNPKEMHRRSILSYSTRVETIIPMLKQPLNKLQFGVEWEVTIKGEASINAMARATYQLTDDEHVICKQDGSVRNGFEIVTRPATASVHKQYFDKLFNNKQWLDNIVEHSSCGVHIHVSRAALTQLQIGRLIAFIHNPSNREFVKTIARRLSEQWSDYRSVKSLTNKMTEQEGKKRNYSYVNPLKDMTKQDPDSAKTGQVYNVPFFTTEKDLDFFAVGSSNTPTRKLVYSDSNKYVAVNTRHTHTIEFRMFAGTNNREILFSYLEFIEALVLWTSGMSGIKDALDHTKFKEWLQGKYTPHGATYPLPSQCSQFPNLCARLGIVKAIPAKYATTLKTSAAKRA